jgi:hypothetical protein
MGNAATESKKRGGAAHRAIWHCPDCKTYAEDGNGGQVVLGPDSWCDQHRCSAITRTGTRCQNAATYPDMPACGIHAALHPVTAQRHEPSRPLVERTFTAVRAALPAESVSAFESQLAQIARADTVDLVELDRFLSTWHGIVSRYVGDPEDWRLMHEEAAAIESGERPRGPTLAEVLARRGAYLDNPKAVGARPNARWGYLPCGCENDGFGNHASHQR